MTKDHGRAAAERLVDFQEQFAPTFGKAQAQDSAFTDIKGLMICPERKNIGPIARNVGNGNVCAIPRPEHPAATVATRSMPLLLKELAQGSRLVQDPGVQGGDQGIPRDDAHLQGDGPEQKVAIGGRARHGNHPGSSFKRRIGFAVLADRPIERQRSCPRATPDRTRLSHHSNTAISTTVPPLPALLTATRDLLQRPTQRIVRICKGLRAQVKDQRSRSLRASRVELILREPVKRGLRGQVAERELKTDSGMTLTPPFSCPISWAHLSRGEPVKCLTVGLLGLV